MAHVGFGRFKGHVSVQDLRHKNGLKVRLLDSVGRRQGLVVHPHHIEELEKVRQELVRGGLLTVDRFGKHSLTEDGFKLHFACTFMQEIWSVASHEHNLYFSETGADLPIYAKGLGEKTHSFFTPEKPVKPPVEVRLLEKEGFIERVPVQGYEGVFKYKFTEKGKKAYPILFDPFAHSTE